MSPYAINTQSTPFPAYKVTISITTNRLTSNNKNNNNAPKSAKLTVCARGEKVQPSERRCWLRNANSWGRPTTNRRRSQHTKLIK